MFNMQLLKNAKLIESNDCSDMCDQIKDLDIDISLMEIVDI